MHLVILITAFVVLTSTTLDLRTHSLCSTGAPYCNSFTKIYHIDNFINNMLFIMSMVSLSMLVLIAAGISIYIGVAIIPIVAILAFKWTAKLFVYLF